MKAQLLAAVMLFSAVTQAQENMVPFPLPPHDTSRTLTDVSWMNRNPAGFGGRIVARGGHFAESESGKRVRFVGINLTFGTPFVSREDATTLAARLAKFGFNAVRLHLIDVSNYSGASIWDSTAGNFRKLDPAKLDRLDFLVNELKKRGIYTNINLHVGRKFTPQDGLPESVKNIKYDFHKRVTYFEPRMIELQKEYARDLLTHKNPYTGNAYVDEPAVAFVEITNENSLAWFDKGADLVNLPEPFLGELRGQWNKWLLAKYGSTQKLNEAWNPPGAALGDELLRAPNDAKSWSVEKHTAQFDWAAQNGILSANVQGATRSDWHAQAHQTGLTLESGKTYTLQLQARAPQSRSMNISLMLNQPDWRNLGLRRAVKLTPEWKEFFFIFKAQNTVPAQARLSLQFGEEDGVVEVKNISLRPGAAPIKVNEGTLEKGDLPLRPEAYDQALHDWLEFLLATERAYATGMYRYLKDDLRLRALVTCSQVNYGDLIGLWRENDMDYIDNHAYWDHPDSPEGWKLDRLTYHDKPMVPELGKDDQLSNLARWRVEGKPYVISEYLHPHPNSYGSETVPLLATIASRQDWDGIYLHEYGFDSQKDADFNSAVRQPFMVSGNPAWMCYWPAMAVAFRQGLIPAAPKKTHSAEVMSYYIGSQPTGKYLASGIHEIWKNQPSIFDEKLELKLPGDRQSIRSRPDFPRREISILERYTELLNEEEGKGTARFSPSAKMGDDIFVSNSPTAYVVTGKVANQRIAMRGAIFNFGAISHNFASLTLGALDAKPLRESDRLLLTVVAKAANTGFEWDAEHRRAAKWGTAPVRVEVPKVDAQIIVDGPRRVWALDATGATTTEIPARFQDGLLSFSISSQNETPWFAIVRP